VTAADGTLDRAALGRLVFADPAALRELEGLVHPAVRPRILEEIAAAEDDGAPAVVIEAIKLVEGGLSGLCDEVWLVSCDGAAQRERLASRGVAPDVAAQRISAQDGLVERLRPVATRIVDTSGDEVRTRTAVEAAFRAAVAARG
jgi:dephospho-CoA kinase